MSVSGVRKWLFGRELRTAEAPQQAIGKFVGLAVFASDALSSVAYAPGEILFVLAAGAAGYWLSIPISVAICGLLIILTLSYRQTIFAYPSGGGSYIVARDNLGESAAQVAGAALLTDYVLTVAVSIASGVDQLASAFPALFQHKVQLSLLLILFMALMNLRGIKESGKLFAVPTYFFIAMMALTIGTGLWKAATGTLGTVGQVPGAILPGVPLSGLAMALLILRSFSSGTTAITGIEAISDGIPAFREPKAKNAATTMLWMAILLMSMFLGLVVLGWLVGAQPSEHEVHIAQVTRVIFGAGAMRVVTLMSATVILVMAANTSFADFPRLTALVAGDGFLPKQFTFRSSRLVFNVGVVALAALASLLIIVFQGRVTLLIPLYAVGVFTSLTLSQTGMVKRWAKVGRMMRTGELVPGETVLTRSSVLQHDRTWRVKQIMNGTGAVVTAIVTLVFLVSKFVQGAWIVMVLIPGLLLLFLRIHSHYKMVARVMSTAGTHGVQRHPIQTVVLVDNVHRETLRLVEFAKSMKVPWKAVHVGVNADRIAEVQKKWKERVAEGDLVILESPYRSISRPIREYVLGLLKANPDGFVHLVFGELRTGNTFTQLLHQNSHLIQQLALQDIDRIVISIVPFSLQNMTEPPPHVPPVTPAPPAPTKTDAARSDRRNSEKGGASGAARRGGKKVSHG